LPCCVIRGSISECGDLITQAILARAFRGELVPQDLTDEPAHELLERIRAGQAADGEKDVREPQSNDEARQMRLPGT